MTTSQTSPRKIVAGIAAAASFDGRSVAAKPCHVTWQLAMDRLLRPQ